MDALETHIWLLTAAYSLLVIGLVLFVCPIMRWMNGKTKVYVPRLWA